MEDQEEFLRKLPPELAIKLQTGLTSEVRISCLLFMALKFMYENMKVHVRTRLYLLKI